MYESWRARDPGPGRDVDERFRALPFLTKADIRAFFPHGLVPKGRDLDAALARGELSFVRTSGTADEALQNIWNQAWWDASERASWSLNSVARSVATGTHAEAILASALSVGARSEGPTLDREKRRLGRFLFLNEFGRTEEWPPGHEARILAELAEEKPAVLEANPSLLARVCRWAARHGVRPWQPPLITLTYEFPSALHLKAIRRVFSSPVASSYGSTEAGYVFMECEHGRLHQNTEFCRVDLGSLDGDADLEPREGALGKLLVSTLGNEWFPLLRFEIGDVGRVAGACPCGRTDGLVLSAVEGRLKSLCVGSGGRLVTHARIDSALSEVEGLEQYRLDQATPNEARLSVVAAPEARAADVAAASRRVAADLLGPEVRVQATSVPELLPEPSGKFLLVHRSFPLPVPGTTRS